MRYFLYIICCLLFLLSPAQAKWHEVATDNFVVAGDASLGTLKKFAIELEQFRVFLAVVTGQEPTPEPVPVEVYLMANKTGLKKIFNRPGAAGVYVANLEKGVFAADVSRKYSEKDLQASDVVKHEYVHHYSYRTGPFYYPAWYREGIADYFATFEYKNGIAEVGKLIPLRIDWLARKRWKPLEHLIRSKNNWYDPSGKTVNANDVAVYYAQSWFTTHYLQHSKRAGQLNAYLRSVREGADLVTAFEENFSASMDEIQSEIDAVWRSRRLPLLKINLAEYYFEPALRVTPLDKDEGQIRLALAGSYFNSAKGDTLSALEEALEDNPQEIRLLARLAFLMFNKDNASLAKPYVDRAVQVAPGDARTLVLEGLTIIAAADATSDAAQGKALITQARAKFNQAREARPKYVKAHFEYSRSFRRATEIATEEALSAALTALELSPNSSDVPLNAAVLLSRRGYTEDAVFLLEGLASWSSSTRIRRDAQAELDRIKP